MADVSFDALVRSARFNPRALEPTEREPGEHVVQFYDDETVYVACSDIPLCPQNPHVDDCAVGIVRAALTATAPAGAPEA